MIKRFISTASQNFIPGNGYIWKVLSVYISLTAVASTSAQNCYVSRKGTTEILGYVSNQSSAGTVDGQGAPESYSNASYLTSYYSFPVITYNDGIEVSITIPSGATCTVAIVVDEYPEA